MLKLEKHGWKSSYTTEIAAAKAKYVAETDRLYNLEYTGKDFVPEIDDALDTDKVYEEFHNITGSYLTQSRAFGIINQFVAKKWWRCSRCIWFFTRRFTKRLACI